MQDGSQAVVQQPAQLTQGGQVIQLAATPSATTVAQPAVATTPQPQASTASTSTSGQQSGGNGNQNIIMMVPGAAGGSPTIQRIPLPGKIFFPFWGADRAKLSWSQLLLTGNYIM